MIFYPINKGPALGRSIDEILTRWREIAQQNDNTLPRKIRAFIVGGQREFGWRGGRLMRVFPSQQAAREATQQEVSDIRRAIEIGVFLVTAQSSGQESVVLHQVGQIPLPLPLDIARECVEPDRSFLYRFLTCLPGLLRLLCLRFIIAWNSTRTRSVMIVLVTMLITFLGSVFCFPVTHNMLTAIVLAEAGLAFFILAAYCVYLLVVSYLRRRSAASTLGSSLL